MESVRRGARAVMKYFAPLIFVLILIQILLAGEGIFGIKHLKKDIGDAKTLDPHRFLGFLANGQQKERNPWLPFSAHADAQKMVVIFAAVLFKVRA